MRKSKLTVDPLSLRKLATAIGVKVQQLSKESKRSGFPFVTIKGKRQYQAAEVMAWREKNIRTRKVESVQQPPDGKLTEPSEMDGHSSLASADDPFILAMMSGQADALTISRASMQMASRLVAKAAVAGTLGAMDLDGLKKTLTELRGAEAGYIEIEKSKRNLIERSEVDEIVGCCVGRLVKCLSVVENSIATEVDLWIADPKMQAMGSDDRKRIAREYVARVCFAVRKQEADDVRALIDTKPEDQQEEEEL